VGIVKGGKLLAMKFKYKDANRYWWEITHNAILLDDGTRLWGATIYRDDVFICEVEGSDQRELDDDIELADILQAMSNWFSGVVLGMSQDYYRGKEL